MFQWVNGHRYSDQVPQALITLLEQLNQDRRRVIVTWNTGEFISGCVNMRWGNPVLGCQWVLDSGRALYPEYIVLVRDYQRVVLFSVTQES